MPRGRRRSDRYPMRAAPASALRRDVRRCRLRESTSVESYTEGSGSRSASRERALRFRIECLDEVAALAAVGTLDACVRIDRRGAHARDRGRDVRGTQPAREDHGLRRRRGEARADRPVVRETRRARGTGRGVERVGEERVDEWREGARSGIEGVGAVWADDEALDDEQAGCAFAELHDLVARYV